MSARDIFKGMHEFLLVGQTRNFRKAAEIIGVSPAAVGASVKQLESRLDQQLFHRTTRSVEFTPAGRLLFGRLNPSLDLLEDTVQELSSLKTSLSGVLRISVQSLAVEPVLAPALAEFRERYPDVQVVVESREGAIDIMHDGADIGIRIGQYISPEMVAVPVSRPTPWLVAGSTAFLEKYGRPQEPRDILNFRCIRRSWIDSERHYRWEFVQNDQSIRIDPPEGLTVTDFATAIGLLTRDAGLCYITDDMFRAARTVAPVEQVLTDYMPPPDQIYAYYSPGMKNVRRVSVFVDTLRRRMK
ncbi:LysR family transcriptional regulator [Pseudohalocynthiibacter aestuariivivens]|nr:LysR substrate-binding domain-containing protein [Pseudohalocynthiibacter aestuariivivens]QIE46263.1 LysR family transcriptional regulator [Pseudohalocynthiibacter aestuariivivens]